jgi:hypothetical protein
MSLYSLLKPIIPTLNPVALDKELEVLKMLPPETLFLALKEADMENALWVMENAHPKQIQGVLDLDTWDGDEFLPKRFFKYFEYMTYTTPQKLNEYMKELDPEIIVMALMDCIDVLDFDPQEPPNCEENRLIISPDNKYALIMKTNDPDLREHLLQWLNKTSAADIDLMRRHLESLKWEQRGDLEEFAYQIKKGRIEELGFIEKEEAIKFFSVIKAADLKQAMLSHPLNKSAKEEAPLFEIMGSEEMLPKAISDALNDDDFFKKALHTVGELSDRDNLDELIKMELLRSINGVFSAEALLSSEVEALRESSRYTKAYLNLGLIYLSGANVDEAAKKLIEHPIFDIARLGWNLCQDLVRAAKELKSTYGLHYFSEMDQELLRQLQGRHPNPESPDLLLELGIEKNTPFSIERVHKIAEHLAAMGVLAHFFKEKLIHSLKIEDQKTQENDNVWRRLHTALFRQCCGREFSAFVMNPVEFNEIKKDWSQENFIKLSKLIEEKIPDSGKVLFAKRNKEFAEEVSAFIKTQSDINPSYFKNLFWENTSP